MKIMKDYENPVKVWFGNNLSFFVSEPKYLEIIFNHPKALNKHDSYKYIKPLVGNGLFTAPG